MVMVYFFLLFLLMSLNNIYIVWLLMELMFVFFLMFSLNNDVKSVGLIVYFFFQSVMSLFLFMALFYSFDKIIFILLSAKLGVFPFFYWMILVSLKVGLLTNMFVLGFQKVSVFWMLWLTLNVSTNFIILAVYFSLFFVTLNLLMVSDLWLMMVYSSIVNTSLILLSVFGGYYFYVILIYLSMIFFIIFLMKYLDSYMEMLFIVFLFLVIPPFILFFMKFYIVLSMDFFSKLIFFIMIFDVLILLYYFSLIFMKFMLMDSSILIYLMNIIILMSLLLFSNCVTMIVFY